MIVHLKKMSESAIVPKRAHESDAAFDLCAKEPTVIDPNTTKIVSTGIAMSLPSNVYAFVLSRSGMAANSSVFVLNSPGLIDPGYRGEIKVILHNAGLDSFEIQRGDRIAQVLFGGGIEIEFREGGLFNAESDRGEKGLGSTGACSHENIVFDQDEDAFVCPRCYEWFSKEQIGRMYE